MASVTRMERSGPLLSTTGGQFRDRVDAVADELGVEVVACEYGAEDAGFAMIEGAHGVEGVGGADGSGGDAGPGFRGGGVGVAQGDANTARHGVTA